MRKLHFILRYKYAFTAALLLMVIFVAYNLTTPPELPSDIEVGTVSRGEVIEVVNETGTVHVVRSVALAFERSGRVAEILVDDGSTVAVDTPLLRLEATGSIAELAAANARLEAEQIRLQELLSGADSVSLDVTESAVAAAALAVENAEKNLATVTAQQDQLVTNAKKTLRSTGLEAYLTAGENVHTSNSYESPVITGTYNSDEEGLYTISVYNSGAPSGSSFSISGLEKGGAEVSTLSPIPLGTRGLYIQFPANYARRTTWEIPIPNTRSSAYVGNLNTYESVAEARNVAITAAENALTTAEIQLQQAELQLVQTSGSARSERISAQQALVRQMQALVDQADAGVKAMTITAPFSGTITEVETEIGEVVSPGTPVVSLMSDGQYEIVVDISEVDIAEMTIGDEARVSLDAYPDTIFSAHVTDITPNATIVDGLRVFKVTLAFDQGDEIFKDGLTAEVDITTISKPDVIMIPTRSIYEDESGKFVRTIDDSAHVEIIRITTGLRGTNGFTEVTSGLTEGQTIISFATEDSLKQLEDN